MLRRWPKLEKLRWRCVESSCPTWAHLTRLLDSGVRTHHKIHLEIPSSSRRVHPTDPAWSTISKAMWKEEGEIVRRAKGRKIYIKLCFYCHFSLASSRKPILDNFGFCTYETTRRLLCCRFVFLSSAPFWCFFFYCCLCTLPTSEPPSDWFYCHSSIVSSFFVSCKATMCCNRRILTSQQSIDTTW